jgi:hypothetical protein
VPEDTLQLADINVEAEHLSDIVAEDAGSGAAVHTPGGLNPFPSDFSALHFLLASIYTDLQLI